MERHMRLSRAAVVLVAIALIASIAAAVCFASPDAPYVPSEDSGAALGTAAPAEDGYAEHETTVPGGYTPVRSDSDVDNMRSNGRKSNNKYILMNNITIDSIDLTAWTGADGSPWKSELDGNGYTITINAATASGAYYDTGGLFSVIGGGAYVHDLTIVVQNVRVDNNEGSANFGVIAGNACGAVTVDNVYIRLDKDSSGNGDAYVSSNGTTWLGGVFGKVEGSGVSIKNTTVYNAAAGSRGFSGTMVNNLGVYVGGFVGSIDKGDLTVSNIAYKADDDAKIFAVAESGAGFWESNTTLTGGVLGYHNDGSFTLDGLIFDAQVTLGSSFGTQNGDTAHAAYIVGQVDDGLSDVWSDIYINAANGTTWLDGNNETRGNFIRYDAATFTDARFADDGKIVFAVSRQTPAGAGSVMRTIVQENTTTTLSDAEIADIVSSGDGPAWITVDRVNATGKNSLSIGSKATAGTYNVQNYDAVSSADGSAYRGSKVYDGTTVKTPTLDVGGTTVNAWTADSTTADVGTKTFGYNADALSGYAAAAYNGGTYLVKDGTIYSPGKITVNGAEQTFDLGKNFVYEITQAPVTVTPKVPTDLYAGNPMPEITATAVDSGGSPVEGKIAWDDPDATLISGKNSYGWTWTPTSSNYQTVKDSMELEAFDRKIESLSVQGVFKTEYTAYEPFNSTGVEVIAHYSDGTQAQLVNGEYEFTVVNGDINKLIVANDTVTVSLKAGSTVSTTIEITVVELTVDVPTAVADLVYNGTQQTGVENAEHYTLTGNTEVDAGDYTATATLTDKANTVWAGGSDADVTIKWTIAQMTLDGTVSAAGSLKYDGNAKEAAFDLTTGTLFGSDQVTIVYDADDRTNVTGEAVTATAQLPNNGNYKWATDAPSASFVVDPKTVEIGVTADLSKTYDGNVVDPKSLFTAPQGVDGGALALTVTVDGGEEILNAGSYTVTAVLADGQTNYTAQSAQATYEIAKVVLTGTLTFAGTATYDGTAKTATFNLTSDNLVGQDKVGEVTYNDVDRINVTGQAIVASVALPSSGNYQWQDGDELTASLTIVKATPVVNPTADVQGTLYTSDDLYDIVLNLAADDTPGKVSWDEGQRLTAGEQGYNWTFVPTDEVNYNGATGVIKLTAVQAQLDSVTVDVMPNTAYTAFDAFDPTGMVVTAHYENGDTKQVAPGDLSLTVDQGSIVRLVVASTTVTVSYSDGDVTKSTTVTIEVSPLAVTAPTAVEDLVYNGAEQTGVEKGDHYTLSGNTAEDAGDYTATATLTDKANTVWSTGGTDNVTIPWTIAQMTLDGTVSADSLEYDGTQKSAQFVTSQGELFGGDEVGMQYSGDRTNVTVDGFTATAQLPSDNYKWATDAPSESFAVTPKSVVIDVTAALSKTYDGQAVDPAALFPAPDGVDGQPLELTATVDGGKTILNAGSYTVTAVLADGQTNYTAKSAQATYEIAKVVLTGTLTFAGTATYDGTAKTATFNLTSDNLVGQDKVGEVTYNDVDRINVTGQAIVASVALPSSGNYQWQDGDELTASLTIVKATPVVNPTADVQGTLYTSDDLYAIALKLGAADTPGTVSWDEGQRLIAGEQGYNWTFVPTDSVNYNGATGVIKLTAVQAALTGIRVSPSAQAEYTAYDAFDRGDIVVEAVYGDVVRAVGDYALRFSSGAEGRLVAGEITVTVSYGDGGASFEESFVIVVAKLVVEKPVVGDTTFEDNGGQITLEIAPSEFYTVTGNTGFGVGSYLATVSLVDADNTVWADGSVDDISIAWTISEPVTSDEVIADILAMEKVTWQNAEEFLDLEARYNALDESEKTAEATAKLATLKAQYDALRNAAFDDIEAAHEVTAKSLGKALAAAAAGLSAAAIALAIAKRRSI